MPASRRAHKVLLLLLSVHLLIAFLAGYIDLAWGRFAESKKLWATLGIGASGPVPFTMAMLAAFAADTGLLGAWAVLAPFGRAVRRLSAAFCAACWAFGFLGQSPPEFFHDLFWRYGFFEFPSYHYYELSRYTSFACLPTLVVFGTALGLTVAARRGMRLRRLNADDLASERGSRQFGTLHLLWFVFVLSLLLALCVSIRSSLSAQISKWWRLPAEAPVYCAETVLMTALLWISINLAQMWAALSLGRPWLRLAMAWTASAALGFAGGFAFTMPEHEEHLFWNGLFAAGAGLAQSLLVSLALLYVRRGGHRLVRDL